MWSHLIKDGHIVWKDTLQKCKMFLMKVDVPNLRSDLKWRLVFGWCMVECGS